MPFTALPADRPRAEAGVRAAYAAAGLPSPARFLWVSSPAAGALLSVLLHPGLRPSVRADLLSCPLLQDVLAHLPSPPPVRSEALAVPGPLVPAGEDRALGTVVAPRRAVRAARAEELLAWLGEVPVGASVRERVRTAPWERERAAAHAELGPRGWSEAWSKSGALTWDQVNALVTRIRRAIGELGGPEHGALLRGGTLDAVLGQHDAPWLELFASLGRLEPLRGLAEVAASAGWWWPYENLVILSERPAELHRDEPGRLHNGTGPALAHPDGFALHAWRGMPIPPGFLDTLTGLTPRRILAEDNAELRRVMLEHFGYDRYLSEIGAKPLHKDETGVLWRIDLPDDEPVVMVEVVNSTPEPDGTHRTYYLRVPPDTPTARAGVAWTFGLTAAEYRPLQET